MGSQADWNSAASAYAGVPVCGCANQTIDGQKLYRLTNYYFTITNQPAVTDPPVFQDVVIFDTIGFYEFDDAHGNPIEFQLVSPATTVQAAFVLQEGKGLQNYVFGLAPFPAATSFFPGNHLFNYLAAHLPAPPADTCGWLVTGQPIGTFGFTAF